MALYVSAFEGGIFANVSTPGEKLLLLYIVLEVVSSTFRRFLPFWVITVGILT